MTPLRRHDSHGHTHLLSHSSHPKHLHTLLHSRRREFLSNGIISSIFGAPAATAHALPPCPPPCLPACLPALPPACLPALGNPVSFCTACLQGFSADVAACRQLVPGMLNFRQFLEATHWADPGLTYDQGVTYHL